MCYCSHCQNPASSFKKQEKRKEKITAIIFAFAIVSLSIAFGYACFIEDSASAFFN